MKRLLIPLLAALALPTAVNANVDPKVAEMCMKAVDFQGCVKAFSGNENNNDKALLIKELKKLEGRITNTSLRDYPERTQDFIDAISLVSVENVGEDLYESSLAIRNSLNILYEVYNKSIEIKSDSYCSGTDGKWEGYYTCWDKNQNALWKSKLDRIFNGNTFELSCYYHRGIGRKWHGSEVLDEVINVIIAATNQVLDQEKFSFPSNNNPPLIKVSGPQRAASMPLFNRCEGDSPFAKKKKDDDLKVEKKPIKINCKSAVWKNKPVCKK